MEKTTKTTIMVSLGLAIALITFAILFFQTNDELFTVSGKFENMTKARDYLQGTLNSVTAEKEYLQSSITSLTAEKGNLINAVSELVIERDEARLSRATLQERLTIAENELAFRLNEVETLKERIIVLGKERDEARLSTATLQEQLLIAENELEFRLNEVEELKLDVFEKTLEVSELSTIQSYAIDRVILVGGTVTDTGSVLVIKGHLTNTGLNDVYAGFYFEGWDLLEQKCINITSDTNGIIGKTTFIENGQYLTIECQFNYVPYALSNYKVSIITATSIYTIAIKN